MLQAIGWIVLGTASTAAILTGVFRHRPARVGPWLLLASAVAALSAGDACYALGDRTLADVCYLAMFALVAAGLLLFTRGGVLPAGRGRLVDILALATSLLLLVWVFVIGGHGRLAEISAGDVIGDLLLLGVAGRLLVATGRTVSAALLLAGAAGSLVSDITYPLHPGRLTETGYLVLYVAWGAAALHPSMTRLTRPAAPRPAACGGRWAVLLGAAVATPPAVLLAEAVAGPVEDGVVIAVAAALTLLLTITRLSDSTGQHARALARERALRTASAALVSAADLPAVDDAVRAAVAQLTPAGTVRQVLFAPDDRRLALTRLPATPAEASRSWWPLPDGPGNDDATLVCPLWLEPLAVARPGGGALAVTGRRDVLTAARDALEVLAGQAALALDRITLVEAVGRRDSDLYLRAVIRNTADLMLVLDEDQRIRYASPALRDLLGGDEPSPLATLTDLVAADDRGQLRRALLAGGDGTLFCALVRPGDNAHVLVEATYRDLRTDRLVQGFVITVRPVPAGHDPVEQLPHLGHVDVLPAWVNRRSAQHKFRY